jgi:hypothetical protein
MREPTDDAYAPWLERIDGDAPLLLIAPHGGRAGAAARKTLHPKVNDLETAAITREIAGRLGARALINAAMDRNELDCNRLSQLTQRAPWLLELIVKELEAIIRCSGHATVLLIHGWNIIEPRIDLGLGLKDTDGILSPPPGAHVSANDSFIDGPVSVLAARLRDAQIRPTFGLRYPGGAAQNLLQGFTPRHADSAAVPLQQLAKMAAAGLVNALQLEMSVAVRLPGKLRERAIRVISETFVHNGSPLGEEAPPRLRPAIRVVRQTLPPGTRKTAAPGAPPSRVGIEFYDPAARLGGMVSFDFGPGAAGGRIMILLDSCRVALFTAEGTAIRDGDRLSIGPLSLNAAPGGSLSFRGPVVVVEDGTAYLSVEHALAAGRLDAVAEVEATLEFDRGAPSFSELLIELDKLLAEARASQLPQQAVSLVTPPHAVFGRLRGSLQLNNSWRNFDANFRLGPSFTGLGPQKFITRRMVWSNFAGPQGHDAFEARTLELDGNTSQQVARILRDGHWIDCSLAEIQIPLASSWSAPERISAIASNDSGVELSIEGEPGTFVVLSRPGPDGTRLHTLMGFAKFKSGNLSGAGMYEFSRRVGLSATDGEPAAASEET